MAEMVTDAEAQEWRHPRWVALRRAEIGQRAQRLLADRERLLELLRVGATQIADYDDYSLWAKDACAFLKAARDG